VQLADSDPDSLMRVWAGQDRPEYLLLRGHRSEQAGQGQTARTDWLNFLDRYPFHPYTDYIHYRLGRSYAGEDSWRAALDHLLPLHRAESHTGELEHRIATTLVDLYQQLNPADGEEMLARLNRPLARRCLAAVAAARGKLAVLPLSGSDSEWGRDLARSLRIGRELFAPSGPELPLLDDRSDPLYHAQLLAALTDDRDWLLLQSARAEFLAPVQLLPRLHVVCPDRTFPATEALPTLSLHLDPLLQARCSLTGLWIRWGCAVSPCWPPPIPSAARWRANSVWRWNSAVTACCSPATSSPAATISVSSWVNCASSDWNWISATRCAGAWRTRCR